MPHEESAIEKEDAAMNQLHIAGPSRMEGFDGESIRGIASSVGNVDYAARCFLPGAFGAEAIKVPFLLNHEEVPLGESVLMPSPLGLRHDSKIIGNPTQPKTGVAIRQLLRQGYNATSIGWIDEGSYYGWKQLERANPELAQQATAAGVEKHESVRYFAKVRIVENSLCPVGANPQALLDAASLLPHSEERGYLEEMAKLGGPVEVAAGARHSHEDNQTIQQMHDLASRLGAACASGQSSFRWYSPNTMTGLTTTNGASGTVTYTFPITINETGEKEKVAKAPETTEVEPKLEEAVKVLEEIHTEEAADKPSTMPNGSYPISSCSDVSDAAKLAHHSKEYSFEEVRKHVMSNKNRLNCPDSVIPESWGEQSEGSEIPKEVVETASSEPLTTYEVFEVEKALDELST